MSWLIGLTLLVILIEKGARFIMIPLSEFRILFVSGALKGIKMGSIEKTVFRGGGGLNYSLYNIHIHWTSPPP